MESNLMCLLAALSRESMSFRRTKGSFCQSVQDVQGICGAMRTFAAGHDAGSSQGCAGWRPSAGSLHIEDTSISKVATQAIVAVVG